jgi:rare lipoprotein A
VASWYGRPFHGRRTANGERYNMHAMTAAHPTLPLSAVVRVTNLDNGRSIVVRINDRGPFARGRIIDVSQAGARALGFEARGTARVRVAIIAASTQTAERAGRETAAAVPPRPTWE